MARTVSSSPRSTCSSPTGRSSSASTPRSRVRSTPSRRSRRRAASWSPATVNQTVPPGPAPGPVAPSAFAGHRRAEHRHLRRQCAEDRHGSPADQPARPGRTVPPSARRAVRPSAVVAQAPVAPAANRASRSSCARPAASRATTALASTVGRNGPGSRARPASSTATASSGSPASSPPARPGRWRASRPCWPRASHQAGRRPRARFSNSRRVADTGACRAANLATDSASAT